MKPANLLPFTTPTCCPNAVRHLTCTYQLEPMDRLVRRLSPSLPLSTHGRRAASKGKTIFSANDGSRQESHQCALEQARWPSNIAGTPAPPPPAWPRP